MVSQAQTATLAVIAAGIVCTCYWAYRISQEYRKKNLPTKWRLVGRLKKIYVYPIKSCAANTVEKAECTMLGLKDGWLIDRNLMVVDDFYNFITARTYPELLQVRPSLKKSVLTLEHHSLETITVDLAEVKKNNTPRKATIWFSEVHVYDCGSEVSQWFTKLLNKYSHTYHLVHYASEKTRKSVDPRNNYFRFSKDDLGAFPDDAAYNLINEASVDDLNIRISNSKVSALQFRPNFVLAGGTPYDEDSWSFIKVGGSIFEIVRPCVRCTMTTLDPETGARNTNNEPLNTLKRYRQIEDEEIRKAFNMAPRMGVQIALRSAPGGTVSLQDPIYVA
ncbi:unnamed protein product [Chilo suppressalis]|uniref:MOSC domain-containing protein n=1 Tax=Chilo suppressalis TaxID=168631 RepID=A0ABN8B456_CHISP|nr:hypothetical protein evm_000223 [Chilo suppressalis]CAH0400425.1 unnamed protein product [Chilo suppressalis]